MKKQEQTPEGWGVFSSLSHHPRSRRGFTRQPENSKRAQTRVPAFKNTTKIQREDPERHKKSEMVAGGKKKTAKFWAVRGEGSSGRGSGGRWSKEVQTNNNHNNHNHNNAKPRTSGAPKGGEGLGLWELGFSGSENLAKTLDN